MKIDITIDGAIPAVLTIEHAASCHGIPVLVIDGVALGPADFVTAGYKTVWPVEGMTAERAAAIKAWAGQHPMAKACVRGCGRVWFMRSPVSPAHCPSCGVARWDTPRTGREPGPKPRNV